MKMKNNVSEWSYEDWLIYYNSWMSMYGDLDAYKRHKERLYKGIDKPDSGISEYLCDGSDSKNKKEYSN